MINKYPYTDFHEINLDWILRQIRAMEHSMTEFEALNHIKWEGLHSPLREYEAWTIVDTPTHEGYISISAVPTGVAVTNTTYWRQVANYSALYADIQAEIINLQNEDIAINARIDAFLNRRIIFVADSYATYYSGDGNRNYIELGAEYNGYVKNDSYYDFHQSGAGFCRMGSERFVNVLQSHENDVTNPDTITDIIVCGSANDQTGTHDDIMTGISEFVTYARATYPNAKISIGCFSKSLEENYVGATISTIRAYTDAVQYGIEYIAHSECVMTQYQLFRADHLHPLPIGVTELGKYLAMYLSSGKIEVVRDLDYGSHTEYTWDPDGWFDDDPNHEVTVYFTQRNNTSRWFGNGRGLLVRGMTNRNVTIGTGGYIRNKAFYLLDSTFYPMPNNRINVKGEIWYSNGGIDYKHDCILSFETSLSSLGIPVTLVLQNATGANYTIPSGQEFSIIVPEGFTIVQ